MLKESRVLNIAILLLTLYVATIGSYIFYNKIKDKEEVTEGDPITEVNEVDQTIVNNLYNLLYIDNEDLTDFSLYRHKKIFQAELTSEEELIMVTNLNGINPKKDYSCEIFKKIEEQTYKDCLSEKLIIYEMPLKEMTNSYEKIFGTPLIPKTNFNYTSHIKCKYSESYICYSKIDDNNEQKILEKHQYYEYKVVEEDIEIYDFFLYLEIIDKGYNVYNNLIAKELLTTITDKEEINYEEYGQKYKHVFKKNNQGNYYWYSTEVIV